MGISIAFEELSFLVVDDNDYMRTILRTILNSFGAHRVYEARNGADGLEKLRDYSPDIAIIDWEMPVMSGPEMIKKLRNPDECRQAFVPIILITAHTERKRIIQARNFGAHEILRKPVSSSAIYQRVASIILQPRPFIRTPTYFGPEPRGVIGAVTEKKKREIYDDKRDGGKAEFNIDEFEGNAETSENAAA